MRSLLVILSLLISSCIYSQRVYKSSGGTYDCEIYYVVSDDTAASRLFISSLLDTTLSTEDFNSRGLVYPSYPLILWLPEHSTGEIIAHELFHLSLAIMKWANIPLSDETEEAYAYEIQYITKDFYKKFKLTKE